MSWIKSMTTRLSTVSNKSLREVTITEKCLHQTSCRSVQLCERTFAVTVGVQVAQSLNCQSATYSQLIWITTSTASTCVVSDWLHVRLVLALYQRTWWLVLFFQLQYCTSSSQFYVHQSTKKCATSHGHVCLLLGAAIKHN